MNIDADVKYMEYISRDIYNFSKHISRAAAELESVEARLRRQTSFNEQFVAIERAKSDLEDERYKLCVLSQALQNISVTYRRAEEEVENSFEAVSAHGTSFETGRVDLTGLRGRVNDLLYGGER